MAIFDKYTSIDRQKFNVVQVVRSIFLDRATIGSLFVNDVFYCYTLEPFYIDFSSDEYKKDIIASEISAVKAVQKRYYGKYVAVPDGVYDLRLDVLSYKYYNKPFFRKLNGGYMPRLCGVPAYDGVLIHTGNYEKDTQGCILVGSEFRSSSPAIFNSTVVFEKLYNKLKSFKYPIKISLSCV